jgi:hypothetical protein
MSVEKPNEGFVICPCSRHVWAEDDGTIRPHRPGRTAGMPNMGNRKARKAAWCDATARLDAAMLKARAEREENEVIR